MARQSVGKGRCAQCGDLIVWRRNESGTLSYFCQECDFQGYAKAGTKANELALEEVAKFGGVPSAPAAPAAHDKHEHNDKPASGLLMG
jgi:hypothetical protein